MSKRKNSESRINMLVQEEKRKICEEKAVGGDQNNHNDNSDSSFFGGQKTKQEKVEKQEFYKTIKPHNYDIWKSETGNIEISINGKVIGLIHCTNWGNEYFISEYFEKKPVLNKSIEKILIVSIICSIVASIFENIFLGKISGISLVPLFIGLNILLYVYSKEKRNG